MNKYLFGCINASAILLCVSTAHAADPVAEPDPSGWTNFYIGGYVGGGAIINNIEIPGAGPGNFDGVGGEGFLYGGRFGFNYQPSGRWVFGVEGEVGGTDMETELNIPGLISLSAEPDFTASVSGRAGYLTTPQTLFYLIGGWSYAEYDVNIAGLISASENYDGFHIGSGIETKLTHALTARIEYRYTEYDGEDWGTGGFLNIEPSSHTGTFGLSWQFYNPTSGAVVTPIAGPGSMGHADDWTGLYVGGYVGGGGVVHDISAPGIGAGNFDGVGGEGFLGGGMLGFNYQVTPNWVVGIQGELGVEELETELRIPGLINLKAKPDFATAVSGRIGWLSSPGTMLYLIGGWSHTEYDVDISIPVIGAAGLSASFSETYDGFHVGGGIETKLTDSLTVRAEYRYTEYDGEDWGTGGVLDVEPSSHTGRIGVAWNFYDLF